MPKYGLRMFPRRGVVSSLSFRFFSRLPSELFPVVRYEYHVPLPCPHPYKSVSLTKAPPRMPLLAPQQNWVGFIPLSACVHPHHLLARGEHDHRCHQGVLVQDALLLRPFPHQRVHHRKDGGDPQLPRREARAQASVDYNLCWRVGRHDLPSLGLVHLLLVHSDFDWHSLSGPRFVVAFYAVAAGAPVWFCFMAIGVDNNASGTPRLCV